MTLKQSRSPRKLTLRAVSERLVAKQRRFRMIS
jgi:hypothetical protein